MNRPEVLAPAGDLEKLRTAFMYGADACYMGMKTVSMRVNGSTLDVDEIEEGLRIAKDLGKKLYLTMNIHAHENKMSFVEKEIEHLTALHELGLKPDGLLISDPGMMMVVQEACPWIDLHLSTQANTLNSAAVTFWAKLGITRVVFGREITLREVKLIRGKLDEKGIDVELEAFVHGAMCMAYSGRCLLSNFMSSRDANEGMCAHSCRWNYKMHKKGVDDDCCGDDREKKEVKEDKGEKGGCGSKKEGGCCKDGKEEEVTTDNDDPGLKKIYVEEAQRKGEFIPIYEDDEGTSIMSAKDMSMIEHLADVVDAGIDSLKIEGRHKTIFYAAITSKVYKMALDLAMEGKPPTEELLDLVETINTRGYFTGFWYGKPGAEGQKYSGDRGDYNKQYCFAGVFRKVEGDTVHMEVKNTLKKGDVLDIITPDEIISITLDEFKNASNGELIEVAHPGQKFTITLKVPGGMKEGFVVRKRL